MFLAPIDPSQFIAAVQPLLERKDAPALIHLLHERWTREQLKSILQGDNLDARKVGCLALALVGTKCCIPCVAEQLKHPDPVINQMAEHALWSIWFRCGSPEANHELCRGTQALNRKKIPASIEHFTRAAELDPSFAEAYNQRALAKYMEERYEESIQDCMETVERMPCHFGAWAGMGHCHAHEGHLIEAVRCYEKALEVNPHLECVRQTVTELKNQIE